MSLDNSSPLAAIIHALQVKRIRPGCLVLEYHLQLDRKNRNGGVSFMYSLAVLSWSVTHRENIVHFCSDKRSHDSQMFLKFSSAGGMQEILISVGSEHHFLVL